MKALSIVHRGLYRREPARDYALRVIMLALGIPV